MWLEYLKYLLHIRVSNIHLSKTKILFYKIIIDHDCMYHLLSIIFSQLFFSVTLRGMQHYFLNSSDEGLKFIVVSSEACW